MTKLQRRVHVGFLPLWKSPAAYPGWVETEGKNCMLLGGHQKTVPVLHLPSGDLKVEAGATSAVKANTGFQYQGYVRGFAPWGGS